MNKISSLHIVQFLLSLIDRTLPCYILLDYEGAVFYRLGKVKKITHKGFHWKIPFLDSYVKTIVTTDTMRIEDVNITTLDGKTATIGGEFDLIVSDIKKALNDGMSKASICRTFEVKRSTLIDSLNRENI